MSFIPTMGVSSFRWQGRTCEGLAVEVPLGLRRIEDHLGGRVFLHARTGNGLYTKMICYQTEE